MFNLTPSQLRQAADLKEEIAGLETQLEQLQGTKPAPSSIAVSKPVKRKMSAAHKAKIKAAQKLRWAKHNAAKAKTAVKPVKKGGMSAEGRARIVAAQKARWAKIKAAKASTPASKTVSAAKVTKAAPVKPAASKPAKKKISAEGIARIKAAQKARWAKIRAEKAGQGKK